MSSRFVDTDVYDVNGDPLASVPSVTFFKVYSEDGSLVDPQPTPPTFVAVPGGPVGKYTTEVILSAGQFARMRIDCGSGSGGRYEDFTVYADDVSNRPTVPEIAAGVWSSGTRTLTSFGSLVADVASAVWGFLTSSMTVQGSVGEALLEHIISEQGEGGNAAPVVSNFSPAPGTPIETNQAISFDVTDDHGSFRRIFVVVEFSSTHQEVIFDGTAFRGYYLAESTKTAISGGFRFSVKREGGWPSTPRLEVYPIDSTGNEAV